MATIQSDPLQGLHDVDWASLGTAYGPAEFIPKELENLMTTDKEIFAKAIHKLAGSLCHQGDRYSASPHAVPFLARLANRKENAYRYELVNFVGSIVYGVEAPYGHSIAPLREILGDGDLELDEEDRRHIQWQIESYEAGSAALPDLIPLLEDEDKEVRLATAHLFASFPDDAATLLPLLAHRAFGEGVEPLSHIRATALLALATLCRTAEISGPYDESVKGELDSTDVWISWAAAMACVMMEIRGDPRPINKLCEVLRQEESEIYTSDDYVPFLSGLSRCYTAGVVLRYLNPPAPKDETTAPPPAISAEEREAAEKALVDGLSMTKGREYMEMSTIVLRAVLPDGLEGPDGAQRPVESLSESQRLLLSVIANAPSILWSHGNFLGVLMKYKVPDHAKLLEYLGSSAKAQS